MSRKIDAVIEADGRVRLLEEVKLDSPRRAILLILDDGLDETEGLAALLSEGALAEDWNRPEEEAAWSHLQPEP